MERKELEILKGNKKTIQEVYDVFIEKTSQLAKEFLGSRNKRYELVKKVEIYDELRNIDNYIYEQLNEIQKTKLVDFAYDMWCEIDEISIINLVDTIDNILIESESEGKTFEDILDMTIDEFQDEIIF